LGDIPLPPFVVRLGCGASRGSLALCKFQEGNRG
jgi:hypothetical protein